MKQVLPTTMAEPLAGQVDPKNDNIGELYRHVLLYLLIEYGSLLPLGLCNHRMPPTSILLLLVPLGHH